MLLSSTKTKIQSIIIFGIFSICVIGHNAGRSGRLSRQENQERLDTCGKFRLPQKALDSTGTLVDRVPPLNWLQLIYNNKTNDVAAASIISSRHVLTSSNLVMNRNYSWYFEPENNKSTSCEKGINWEVPKVALHDLHFTYGISNGETLSIVGATILHSCNANNGKIMLDRYPYKAMLVELSHNLKVTVPCLADESTKIEYKVKFDSYAPKRPTSSHMGQIMHRKHQAKSYNGLEELIFAEKYGAQEDNATALIAVVGDKTTLIAIGKGETDTTFGSLFKSVTNMTYTMCSVAGICPSWPGALTEQEDFKRVETCGKDGLFSAANDKGQVGSANLDTIQGTWFRWMSTDLEQFSPAIMISSRHLITSSELILQENTAWLPVESLNSSCNYDKQFFEVPKDVVKMMKFVENCPAESKCVRAIRAYLVFSCAEYGKQFAYFDIHGYHHPMVVQIDPVYSGNPPCLWKDRTEKVLNSYDIDNEMITHAKVEVQVAHPYLHDMTNSPIRNGSGGALIQISGNRWDLIGFGAISLVSTGNKWYYNMIHLQKPICQLTGICENLKSPVISIPPATPKPNPTTGPPTTSPKTQEETTMPSETSSIPKVTYTPRVPKPSTPERSTESWNTHRPAPDGDQEYEDSLERLEEMSKEDADFDNDILMSRDDWESGVGRIVKRFETLKVLVVVLIFVMVFG